MEKIKQKIKNGATLLSTYLEECAETGTKAAIVNTENQTIDLNAIELDITTFVNCRLQFIDDITSISKDGSQVVYRYTNEDAIMRTLRELYNEYEFI